jgi:hypothetical protein
MYNKMRLKAGAGLDRAPEVLVWTKQVGVIGRRRCGPRLLLQKILHQRLGKLLWVVH